jgi:hypothetical protein
LPRAFLYPERSNRVRKLILLTVWALLRFGNKQ